MPDPNKIKAVLEYLALTNTKEIKMYYRKFIKAFADIAEPSGKEEVFQRFKTTHASGEAIGAVLAQEECKQELLIVCIQET